MSRARAAASRLRCAVGAARGFLLGLAAFVAVLLPLLWHDTDPNDPYDTAILVVIVVAFALAVLGRLAAGVGGWGVRDVAVFWASIGIVTAFGRALAVRLGWLAPAGSSAEPTTDVARAALVVGGVVIVGVMLDWAGRRWAPNLPARLWSWRYRLALCLLAAIVVVAVALAVTWWVR